MPYSQKKKRREEEEYSFDHYGLGLMLLSSGLWQGTDLCVLSLRYLILKSYFQASPCPMGLQNMIIQNTVRRTCLADVQQPDF